MHPWNASLVASLRTRLEVLPHALLIHGPKGIGKLALAEHVAQIILCESAGPARPCGACEGCRWFAAGSHPDFRRVEPEALAPQPASEADETAPAEPARKAKPSQVIKVEQVRDLADFLNVGSHRGRRRVALVHPAEEMNPNAANALLKGLEEPPGGAMFLLVAHRPARLLPTIRSRCVAVPVPVPDRGPALAWLAAEGVKEAERWLSFGGGAPVRAMELADASATIERLIGSIQGQGRSGPLPDTREDLEALAEALQKLALDQALTALGLPQRYGLATPGTKDAGAWLRFARDMGPYRALSRHPLNSRLFAAQMLAEKPEK